MTFLDRYMELHPDADPLRVPLQYCPTRRKIGVSIKQACCDQQPNCVDCWGQQMPEEANA